MIKEEINETMENNEDSLEDIMIYDVNAEYQWALTQTPSTSMWSHPQIFIKLCDGKIIDAINEERKADISQFAMADQGEQIIEMDIYPSTKFTNQLSQSTMDQPSKPHLAHEEILSTIMDQGSKTT